MPYSSAYIAWVRKHAIAEPSVADLAELLPTRRYIDSGHPDLSEGTKATHRSTLATAITAILGGGRRKGDEQLPWRVRTILTGRGTSVLSTSTASIDGSQACSSSHSRCTPELVPGLIQATYGNPASRH